MPHTSTHLQSLCVLSLFDKVEGILFFVTITYPMKQTKSANQPRLFVPISKSLKEYINIIYFHFSKKAK